MAYVLIEDPSHRDAKITERGTADETMEWGIGGPASIWRDDEIAFFVTHPR